MGLETATYINGLVATNPTAGDPVSQGDDHMRLLKSTILATFPNVTGAVTTTHTDLNGATKDHSASGYQKFAGGLYLQWGKTDMGGDSSEAVLWPTAFPNACLTVVAMDLGGNNPIGTSAEPTTTGVTFTSSGTPGVFNWIAVGY